MAGFRRASRERYSVRGVLPRRVPPHPGPLPRGEGGPCAAQRHSEPTDKSRGAPGILLRTREGRDSPCHSHAPRQLEAALLAWQDQVLGRRDPTDDLVAVDGKELLNSQGLAIVSAYVVTSGRWLGSEAVAEGSNEIPAAQELLRRAPLAGSRVTADAVHTQTETARILVQECGADRLFTVRHSNARHLS